MFDAFDVLWYHKSGKRKELMKKVEDYMTVAEAAEYLGVKKNTVRGWCRRGKLPCHINPVNGFRLFDIKDLRKLLTLIERRRDGKRVLPKRNFNRLDVKRCDNASYEEFINPDKDNSEGSIEPK